MEKDSAHKLIDSMPANATWSDLMYEIYVKEQIEQGMDDVKNGRVLSSEEVLKGFTFSK